MNKLAVTAALLIIPLISSSGQNATTPRAGGPTAPSSPDRISVELVGVRTPFESATTDSASGGPGIAVGGEGRAYLLTGSLDPSGHPVDSLCTGAVGSPDPEPERLSKLVHAWRANFKVLSATMESIVVDVDWHRDSARAPGAAVRTAGDRRVITLREGERHTLDFLAAEPGDEGCGRSLRVDVRASVSEDPRFLDERLHYELWLVDEASGRPSLARRYERTARHGELIDFAIPIRYQLPGIRFKDGLEAQVMAHVSGSIRGRVREDGTIDVLLGATRYLGIVEAGKGRTGGIGDGGGKSLKLTPGETLDLVLPPPKGAHRLFLDDSEGSVVEDPGLLATIGVPLAGPAGGVDVDDKRVTVDFAKFLAGHRMSLRLTVTRVPQ